MSPGELYWREPLWLLIALLPGLIIGWKLLRQRRHWRQLADARLLPWLQAEPPSSRQSMSRMLLALAWLLLSLALAGPRTPQWLPPSLQHTDVSVMAIVDFSASMKARDETADRITQAQALLSRWLKEAPGNMPVGLMIFAGHAHIVLEPTADHALVQHYLQQLAHFRPPTLGNNLASALQTTANLKEQSSINRYVLIFSDGDLGDSAGADAATMAGQIAKQGRLHVQVIGMGKTEAVSIPDSSNASLVIDGKTIVSRRQTTWLQSFAQLAGGDYHNYEAAEQLRLEQLLDLPRSRIDPQYFDQILWDEWFFIPLLPGMAFCLLALQLLAPVSRQWSSLGLLVIVAGCAMPFTSRETGHGHFNEGVACYRQKDYACAVQAFSRAAWSGTDEQLRGRAVFNLGNSYFRLGDYEQASVLFRDARLLGVDQNKTRINREFADSLAAAVQQRLADIAKSRQRADWRAQARTIPEGFDELLAEGFSVSQRAKQKTVLANLSIDEQNALIDTGIKHVKSTGKGRKLTGRNFWVLSVPDDLPQQTAGLFNSLMAIESGLHYVPDHPEQIKEQRPW